MPKRRDKPRQVCDLLAALSVRHRVTIVFRRGPLNGIVLHSLSANESEREDVAWIIVKTRGGELGGRFAAWDRLWSHRIPACAGAYEIQSRSENAEERYLLLVFNPGCHQAAPQKL